MRKPLYGAANISSKLCRPSFRSGAARGVSPDSGALGVEKVSSTPRKIRRAKRAGARGEAPRVYVRECWPVASAALGSA